MTDTINVANTASYPASTDRAFDKTEGDQRARTARPIIVPPVRPLSLPCADDSTYITGEPIYIKQVRQALLMEGLARVLADIYGDRSQMPLSLSDLLHHLGVDSLVVSALSRTQGQPVANKLIDRLSHRLALTSEGQKQFQVLRLLYGLSGDYPRTASEISSLSGLALKDVKHLSIMMRCRLESEQIKSFVEETLKLLTKEFSQSLLFDEIIKGANSSKRVAKAEALDLCSDVMHLEQLAESLADNIAGSPTVNIAGQAGTGKTSLALKTTARLLQQGKKVLFVAHSRFFANHVQTITRFYPGDLTVSTFHALCHLYAREADIEIPSYRNNKVFNELFPELLIAAVHTRPENTFDAIVVDEGHALLPNFWRALKFCLKDLQRGGFFYFYDPLIMQMAKNKSTPFATQTVTLTTSMRPNFALAERQGGVEVYEAISKEEVGQAVSRIVTNLLNNQIRADEMVILCGEKAPKISESRYNLPRGVKLAATPGNRDRHILYTSLSSFRAMTKRVVILTLGKEIEELADWKLKYLSYSAFSRADEKLILVGNIKTIEKVLPSNAKLLNPEAFEPQLRRH